MDQAVRHTARTEGQDSNDAHSELFKRRLLRLEKALNIDLSPDSPTILRRPADADNQRLLRLEKAVRFRLEVDEHFKWDEHSEVNAAHSSHVVGDAKETQAADAKPGARQRLRYQPPVGIGGHACTRASSTATQDTVGQQGATPVGLCASSLLDKQQIRRPTPKSPKRKLCSLKRLPPVSPVYAKAATLGKSLDDGDSQASPTERSGQQIGEAWIMQGDLKIQDRLERPAAQSASEHRRGSQDVPQDEPPTPLLHPTTDTQTHEVQAHVDLHTDAPRAVADVFYNNRDAARASEEAGTFTSAIDSQGNFRAWHPLLVMPVAADSDTGGHVSDFSAFIDANGNFARKPSAHESDAHGRDEESETVGNDVSTASFNSVTPHPACIREAAGKGDVSSFSSVLIYLPLQDSDLRTEEPSILSSNDYAISDTSFL